MYHCSTGKVCSRTTSGTHRKEKSEVEGKEEKSLKEKSEEEGQEILERERRGEAKADIEP
jgi:hypothetical protein